MEDPESNCSSADSDSSDSQDVVAPRALVGKMFHRFRCIRILGQGAMAAVMLGEDIALKRPVAIKLLPREDKSNPGHRVWLDQFVREARAAAQLTHTGIVQVYEIGLHMGYFYIAMEAMLGGSLEDLVRKRGPVPIGLAVAYARQAAEALAYAHRRGVLHRDIKPANILLNDASQCKLGDFGLAVLDDPKDSFELPRNFVGMPYFLAPEVLRHKSSAQSDIYALGATLWFLPTGKYPFAIKETKDVLRVGDGIPLGDLGKLCPRASAELKGLLERALAARPEARFADADEMLRALAELTQPAAPSASARPRVAQSAALSALAKAVQSSNRDAAKIQPPASANKTADQTPQLTGARWGLWLAVAITAVSVIGVAAAGLIALRPWQYLAGPQADAAAKNTTEAPKKAASPQTRAAAEETPTPPAPDDTAKPQPQPQPQPTPTPTPAKPQPAPAKPQAAPVPPVDKSAVRQANDGSITLNADHAILHGALKLEAKAGRTNVGYWLNPKDWVSWEILLDIPGTFEITGDVALTANTTVTMSVGGKPVLQGGKTPIVLKKTGSYDEFQTQPFGKVKIDQPGAAVVEIRAVAKNAKSWVPLNIASIKLTKAK